MKGDPDPVTSLLVQEEGDSTQGDLLNGIGSASSSSTASSVFSASNRMLNPANQQGSNHSTSWTPLTNVDASPSRDAMDSPRRDRSSKEKFAASERYNGASGPGSNPDSVQSSCIIIDKSARRLSARPAAGEVKGEKVRYDPDLDKKLSKKEQRAAKPVHVSFGQKVCFYHSRQINTALGSRDKP